MHPLEAEGRTPFPENRVIAGESLHHFCEKTPRTESPLTLAPEKNKEELMGCIE